MKLPSSTISGGMDGRMIARKQIEQAQVDLDVAVGRLDAAQRQDAFARPRQPQIVIIEAGQLQREIGFHRRAQIRRALRIDVEAAIRQLPLENRLHGLVDQRPRGRIPDAILPADAARAAAGCSRIRAWCRR